MYGSIKPKRVLLTITFFMPLTRVNLDAIPQDRVADSLAWLVSLEYKISAMPAKNHRYLYQSWLTSNFTAKQKGPSRTYIVFLNGPLSLQHN